MIRIVVVDDHEMVRAGVRAILDPDPDFDIVGEASSANDLQELVDRAHPDVVLLDARLPGISGPDACRQLTERHPDVRVLIVSVFTDKDLVEACINAGASGYVVKDIERFALKDSIRAVHRGQAVMSPSVTKPVLDRVRESTPQPELNEKQLQIMRLVGEGYSNKEIASKIYLSENTVKTHLQEIFRKLGVRNRVEAALRASKEGWI